MEEVRIQRASALAGDRQRVSVWPSPAVGRGAGQHTGQLLHPDRNPRHTLVADVVVGQGVGRSADQERQALISRQHGAGGATERKDSMTNRQRVEHKLGNALRALKGAGFRISDTNAAARVKRWEVRLAELIRKGESRA